MLRWILVLVVACLLTSLLGFGGIIAAAGLARTLFVIFTGLLAISLIIGIIRGV